MLSGIQITFLLYCSTYCNTKANVSDSAGRLFSHSHLKPTRYYFLLLLLLHLNAMTSGMNSSSFVLLLCYLFFAWKIIFIHLILLCFTCGSNTSHSLVVVVAQLCAQNRQQHDDGGSKEVGEVTVWSTIYFGKTTQRKPSCMKKEK